MAVRGPHLFSISMALIVALPMLFIIAGLFSPMDAAWEHLRETVLADYISNTLALLLFVAVFASILGVGTGWLIAATDFPGRRVLSWALLLPLAIPPYILAYVYADLLDFGATTQEVFRTLFGLADDQFFVINIRSLPGAAYIMSVSLYPYIYLLARTAFTQRSSTLFSAARSLGASPLRAFFRIALPAARPAIIGGLALVLMETLADFGVVEYFGVPTFSTGIFRTWFAMGEREAALKLAGLMFVLVLLLIALEKYSRKGHAALHARDHGQSLSSLDPLKAWLAFTACFIPVFLGCLLPLASLIYLALTTGDSYFASSFWALTQNSVSVAGIATVITVVIALYFVFSARVMKSKTLRLASSLATLGYALPGVMLAVGLLVPLSQFERSVADYLDASFGWNPGLFLSGTIVLLVYAYVIRFLTPAFNSCDSGLENVPLIFDHVARSLGTGTRGLIKKIHLPLLYKSICVAGLLVFVDTMRELPATLMLRPFNFETLATRVHRLASDERLAEASLAAISIVLIGLLPVLILNRLSERQR